MQIVLLHRFLEHFVEVRMIDNVLARPVCHEAKSIVEEIFRHHGAPAVMLGAYFQNRKSEHESSIRPLLDGFVPVFRGMYISSTDRAESVPAIPGLCRE
jgi:hypothetical protein